MNNTAQHDSFITAGNQLYREIKKVIRRYDRESDITSFQILGALESVKMDIHEDMRKYQKVEGDNLP